MGLASTCVDLRKHKKINLAESNRFGKRASNRLNRRESRSVIAEHIALSLPTPEEINQDDAQQEAYEEYMELYWSTDEWDEEEFLQLTRRR